MKVYLVFLALFIVNISFVTYQSDMNDLQLLEDDLKVAAEELSSGASCFNLEEEFAEGRLEFNVNEAMKWVNCGLEKYRCILTSSSGIEINEIASTVVFYDDSGKYKVFRDGGAVEEGAFTYPYEVTDENGYTYTVTDPCVVVSLEAAFDDAFAHRNLSCTGLKRSTMYENKGRG